MKSQEKSLTPSIILIREHHRQNGLEEWRKWEHVARLCSLMEISEAELFELFGVDLGRRNYFRQRGKVTPELAIHIRILTGWWAERNFGSKAAPVVPVDLLPI